MRIFALLLAAHLVASPVSAHDWYDRECCSDHDCAPIKRSIIQWTPTGWRVVIRPGEHPLARQRIEAVIPFSQIRQSRDQFWHACIVAGRVLCLYGRRGGG